eukprot:12623255-Alexandrium_andersonii.AAC.1
MVAKLGRANASPLMDSTSALLNGVPLAGGRRATARPLHPGPARNALADVDPHVLTRHRSEV